MTDHEACSQIGIVHRVIPADDNIYTTPVIGKPATNTDGRIKLFADQKGGIVWNWSKAEKLIFFYDDTPAKLTTAEKEERAARLAAVEKQIESGRAKCRAESKRDWERFTLPPEDHPYLVAKGIPALGLRWMESGNKLIVPVIDMAGTLHGWQSIGPAGEKRFKTNTVKSGHFHWIKGIAGNSKVIICEGLATGSSLHLATGAAVLVAFDCGNLFSVSMAARERWQEKQIILAADNDLRGEINIGVLKATDAARKIGAALAIPVLKGECHE